mmetsp:Transcript_20704/g.23937  ORF Transcript_20704/g.23937 Transcript_20704/m.23937 type:complete len:92 (-) Transcript_20704:189-464(-)
MPQSQQQSPTDVIAKKMTTTTSKPVHNDGWGDFDDDPEGNGEDVEQPAPSASVGTQQQQPAVVGVKTTQPMRLSSAVKKRGFGGGAASKVD